MNRAIIISFVSVPINVVPTIIASHVLRKWFFKLNLLYICYIFMQNEQGPLFYILHMYGFSY